MKKPAAAEPKAGKSSAAWKKGIEKEEKKDEKEDMEDPEEECQDFENCIGKTYFAASINSGHKCSHDWKPPKTKKQKQQGQQQNNNSNSNKTAQKEQ